MKHLKIGHAAPEFCSKDQDGNDVIQAGTSNTIKLTGPGFAELTEVGNEVAKLYNLNVNDDRGTYYLTITLNGKDSKTLTVNVE